MVSLGLHGGFLAAALLWGQGEELPGASDRESAAISVELVDTQVLEAIVRGAEDTAAASNVAAAQLAGQDTAKPDAQAKAKPVEMAEIEAREPSPEEAEAPPDLVEDDALPDRPDQNPELEQLAPEPLPQAEADTPPEVKATDVTVLTAEQSSRVEPSAEDKQGQAAQPVTSAEAVAPQPPRSEQQQEAKKPRRARGERRRERDRPTAGAGATASVEAAGDGVARSAGRVTASRGAVADYGRRVRARIMQNLPQGGLGSGRVVIGLRIAASGALLGASVMRSSGNSAIARAALVSVRNAGPYPVPPAGATRAQLAFTIPFTFQ